MTIQLAVAVTVGLLIVAVPLVAIARRVGIPYPVVLVATGLGVGFIPGIPTVGLDPNLVLVAALPPLLYWESVNAPLQDMRENAGHIWLLSVGLALVTAGVVATIAHAVIPGFTWPLGILLGAIVAPTDELAAVVVVERLALPRYVSAVVEGESLLNDGTALVLYGAALHAILTGAVNPFAEFAHGVLAVVGGMFLGIVVAVLAGQGWRRFQDPELQRVISFTIPFAAYTPAQALGLSGVIATVTLGSMVNRWTPIFLTPLARLQSAGFWNTVVFMVNVLLYLLLGLQLHSIVRHVLASYSVTSLLLYALILNVSIIVLRFVWLTVQEFIPAINGATTHPEPNVPHALIVAWSGMRGAVSLAAALAVPVALGVHGTAIRDLIVFLAFSVILVTLLLGGLTLPFAARVLRRPGDVDIESVEIERAAAVMAQAARLRIEAMQREGTIDARQSAVLLEHSLAARIDQGIDGYSDALRLAEREMIWAERKALVGLFRQRQIDNTVLRTLQRTLDLAEERLEPWH